MKYNVSIYLDRFLKTDIISHDVDGKEMKGIFIPFAPNNIYTARSGYMAYFQARESMDSSRTCSHYLTLNLTKKQKERWKRELAEKKVTMGYLEPTYSTKLKSSASTENIDDILNKK